MDVWAWVYDAYHQLREDGHDRLADVIRDIPGAALSGDSARTEALCADALALSAGLDVPWLPVFVRHWRLQHRTAVRGEGAVVLTEAVEALEAAHAPETAGCPQAVCTVQDLSICYGRTDGPGWADERIDVVVETLGRIDPSWPCWRCLHDEWALALVHQGRPEEALTKVVADPDQDNIAVLLTALVAAGRDIDAAEAGERYLTRTDVNVTAPRRAEVATLVALAYARAGQHEAAVAALPAAAETNLDDHASWVRAVESLVAAGAAPNTHHLGAAVWRMVEAQRAAGCWFDTVLCALAYVRLAVARGRTWPARRGVEVLQEVLPSLRDPRPVADEVAELAAAVTSAPPAPVALPDDPEELLAVPDEPADGEPDPEEALDRWEAAHRRWPDHGGVVRAYAGALLASGHREVARAALDEHVRRHPEDDRAVSLLVEVLLEPVTPDAAAVTALAEAVRPASPAVAAWALARLAHRTGDWAGCVDHCRQVVAAIPEAMNARRLLADAATRVGEHDAAVSALDEVRQSGRWSPSDEWDFMVAATLAERWDRVRESAARLEFMIEPGEGPIDEEWHHLAIRYDDGRELLALRTGPVTARVVGIDDEEPLRYGDRVVFTPTPIEVPGEDDDRLLVFPHLATVRAGGCRGYEVAGRDLDPEAVRDLVAAVAELGGRLRVFDPMEPDEPTMFGVLAVPPDVAPADVHRLLLERTAGWPGPVSWAALAAAAGDPETAARHEALQPEVWDD
ncbi:MAG TPA: tetratricopeptide repeat protein [Frankiaceae bacterium]|nr:tetratricopeptide repeat protein [Frankiaceae bacterium]